MAYNIGVHALLLIALLFSASNPLAHGQLIAQRGLSVGGSLCCTSTGNCPGPAVAGVPVSLDCTIPGVTNTIGQATTNANGTFNITVPASSGLILGFLVLPCVVIVRLPLDSVICPVLSTTNGVLASAVQSAGTILTATLGLIESATLVGFVNVGP